MGFGAEKHAFPAKPLGVSVGAILAMFVSEISRAPVHSPVQQGLQQPQEQKRSFIATGRGAEEGRRKRKNLAALYLALS